ncbi:MAG TPA: tetratricopeptide repeat protein [Bacteroidia bacterium]|nr:tetratricopeptide repeat protein [Bacteroidia bacterium]
MIYKSMMREKKILLLVFSTACLQLCSAQNPQHKIDSLLQVLSTSKEDTGKVNTLNALGMALSNSNPDTSIMLANQALSLSEKAASKKHIADSYHVIALANSVKGNYPSSLENNFKALSLREELADKSGIAKSLGNIGLVYSDQGDYPKALDYYFKALKMDEELGNKNGIAIQLANIGIVYSEQGDYPKALDYFFKALKMDEELGDKNGIAIDFINIGAVYYKQKDYPKALDYYFKGLKMAEQLGNKNGIAATLGNIGLVYSDQGDYPKALDYYFKALKMAEQLGNKNGIAFDLGTIGLVYTETGKFAEAEVYLKKAIAILDSIGAMDDLRVFEEQLSQLYDTTGRYKLALEHFQKAMVLKDTLFNQEKNKEITRKEMNYEFEKTQAAEKAGHEKQMAVADVEIKKQKVLKYSFIGGLALTILLFFFGYRYYRVQQVLRLQTIRNRIADDLHDDIGSTLNSISIYSEVAKQKSPAVVQELEQIGDASRKIIDAMSDIVWTINTKNDSFEEIILRLRSLTYNLLRAKNIEHTFRADESLNDMKLSMEVRRNFYLIFKEALNNLVKYSNASRVFISLTHENNLITLTLRDNGIGFDVKQSSTGNGLLSMKSRAEEMKAELKIESESGSGTNVELKLKV